MFNRSNKTSRSSVGSRPSRYWTQQNELYGDDWSQVSKVVRKAANDRCEQCGVAGSKDNPIQAHHRIPITPQNSSYANDPSNLIALCKECHSLEHKHMQRTSRK